MKLSVYLMKLLRRMIVNPIVNWYRRTAFLSGLKIYDGKIGVRGPAYLWNDNVSIGGGTNIYPGVTLWGNGKIDIGKNVEVGINCTICSSKSVIISDNCLIAANCYIIDSNHGIEKNELIRNQKACVKGPVTLEEDVWLGAVIGAQAVVNTNIPDYAIAVGVPAKVIGYRKETEFD